MVVHCYSNYGVGSETQLRGCLFYCEVRDLGAKNTHAASIRRKSGFLGGPVPVLLQKRIPRQQEGHVVGLGASGSKGAVGGCGQSGLCAQPVDQFLFDDRRDGSLIERVHGLVESADNDLCGKSGQQRRTMQVRDGVGMVDVHRMVDHCAQGRGDLFGGGRLLRKKVSGHQTVESGGVLAVIGDAGE